MARTDHTIKTDDNGDHVIVFTTDSKQFIPPQSYDERLAWIRSSFDSYMTAVKEKDEVREFCNKA